MPNSSLKTSTLLIRLDKDTKDQFNTICKAKCINASELIRQLIKQWIEDQQQQQ